MKIAITADVHLRSREETPNRYDALENIMHQCVNLKINNLVIAGDLFDDDFQEFGDFERLCNYDKYEKLNIHIIPGNHDTKISKSKIVGENMNIYSEATWVPFGKSWDGLFIPYMQGRLMGELIQKELRDDSEKKWFIIAHGDYIEGTRIPNPYETGIYMPLTRKDVDICDANYIFLGHIHKAQEFKRVYYVGSPCGLNISETGHRRFMVLDTANSKVINIKVKTNVLFFSEQIVVYPTKNEKELLKEQIEKCIKNWDLEPGEQEKVILRVKASGYSSNREDLERTLKEGFKKFNHYEDIDISDVKYSNDSGREYLLNEFLSRLDNLDWQPSENEPNREMIILDALRIIYLEK